MQRRWFLLCAGVAAMAGVPAIGIAVDLLLHSGDPETNIGVVLGFIAFWAVFGVVVSKIEEQIEEP